MPTRNTLVLGLLAFVAGGVAAWTLLPGRDTVATAQDTEDEAPAVDPTEMAVRVRVVSVERGDIPEVVQAVGEVRPDPGALRTLASRAGGRIVALDAAAGDEVKRGDAILRFDPVPLEAAASEARARAEEARNRLAEFDRFERERRILELRDAADQAASDTSLADARVVRTEELARSGLAPDKAVAEARAAALAAHRAEEMARKSLESFETKGAAVARTDLESARDAAEAALKEAEAILAGAVLLAPADGQVLALAVREGDRVDSGAPVGSLLLAKGRLVDFGVSVVEAARVEKGAEASFEDPAGRRRHGTVTRVLGAVEEASGLVHVVVAPEDDGAALLSGLIVRGEIRVGTLQGVLIVPVAAVARSRDAQVVVVVGPGDRAHIVPVAVLGRAGDRAALRGELQPGERVVVEGGYNLPEGAHVVVDTGGGGG